MGFFGKHKQGGTGQRRLKLALGFVALFAVGLLVSGAFGQVTELGGSTSDSTAAATTDTTGASSTDTTAASTTDTTSTDTTSTGTTSTETTPTDPAPADPGTTAPATTPFAPTIASDQEDYPPGGTVTLAGAGWGSGESVHLFVNDSAGDSWSYNADVTADAFGGLTNTFNLPNWFVANYSVKATGASGAIATAAFTDSQPSAVTIAAPLSATVSAGLSTAAYGPVAVTVNGNNTNCTITLAASTQPGDTGLPAGAVASFTNSPITTNASYPSAITVATSLSVAAGTYTFHVNAQRAGNCQGSNDVVSTQQLTLLVKRVGSVTVGSQTGSLAAGTAGSATYTVTVGRTGPAGPGTGFTAALSIGALPSGVTASFSPAQVTFGDADTSRTSTLTLTTTAATPAGSSSFTVTAATVGATGDSASGNGTLLISSCTAPSVTTQPSAQSITYGANVSFSSAASGSPAPTAQWQVSTNGGGTFTNLGGETSTTLSLTKPPVSFDGNQYRATFTNVCGSATSSAAPLSVARKLLTVSGLTAANKVYNGSAAATITGGTLGGVISPDVVSLDTSSGTATFDTASAGTGKTVTWSNPGLSGAAAGNYSLPASLTTTANIDKKPASVTPNEASKIYGGADPTFTGTLSGFLAGDGVTATYSRTAGETVGGSPYTISATLSPAGVLGNYDITSNTAAFTITPKSASVTPNPATKVYGSADPAFTGTLSGFLAGDGVTATYSRTSGETVAGGPYTISSTLSPAGVLGNYTITYNTAAFTISQAAASVTPNAASKIYGNADPTFTGTLSGFLAGDGVTATYARTAGETVAGSPYTISATLSPAAVLGNYAITYNTGAFTITKRAASVTPDPASKTYGGTDPTFTGTLTGFLGADGVTATYSRTAGETVAGSPYTISATLSPAAALDNYTVTYNTASFTIGKKTASVTPNAASKTYGDPDPSLTGTLTGFLLADGVTATYSRTTGETVAGGPYTISATLSPAGVLGNYDITYNTAAFTITTKSASVTPAAASKTYGDPDPALTGSLIGFLAADGVTATYSRTAGETVGDSPYEISATLSPAGVLGNYDITYNTADFTIDKKSASVTPNPATKVYGSSDPGFTGTLSGFLAGDGVTATYSRIAGETVAGGPYTISATLSPAGVLGNYDITYNTALFTISKAAASVTPAAASKTYGGDDPTFSGTLTGFLAGDNVTASYSRTAGETVAGSPYTISATLSPAAVLGNYFVTYNTAAFTINPKSASVTPDAATKTYGDADPALTGALTGFLDGDGVTATYSRTAGETVLGGPYTISATLSPAGVLGNYTITYNTAAFTITTKSASVTPDAASKTYGDVDPTFTGTLDGFLAADSVTATYSRTAGETVGASPYTISATLSPAAVLSNYTIDYNTAEFTIGKKTASVTPAAASKTYGDPDPTLTGSLVGFLATDGVSATYSRTAGETVTGGPYQISATLSPTGVLGNYDITYNTALFTINPKSASVAPNPDTKVYGSADPTFSGTLNGFLAGDNVTASYSRTAGETVAGGPYPITATLSPESVLDNYTIDYNTAEFTISRAAASVTPNAASKIYGDDDPTFTGTLTGFLAGDNVTATYSRTAGETVAGSPYTISATLSPASVLDNYFITSNTAAFAINRKTASVTPNAASKTYGDPDPTLTGTLTGFLDGDGVTASYSRTAGETVTGGPYTISATLSPAGVLANYTITYNTAAFAITTKNASVTPNAASKTYGAADPTLTGTLSGFLVADGVTASYSRTAGETVGGNPYTINATLSPVGVLSNYAITYNTAEFTIEKKNASVTPDAASKTYGDPDPTLTGTLSGFLAADSVTASYSRTAGETVGDSPYEISATLSPAGVLANYDITYNTAEFTIDKKAASVTPNAASKTYGAADPTLTGTLTGFLAGDGVTASYSRTPGETVLGGPYTISATLSPAAVLGNYDITSNTALFTIDPKSASVTPNAASKIYGNADPAFTGTLSGFLAGDNVTATYSRTAGESVAGGPYTISATLSPAAVLGNYAITYNTASFTIGQRAASVTPTAASKTYGEADPTFTGTLSGFLDGDGVTATYTRAAGETVAGSPYSISATLSPASVLSNYAITSNTAAFTIDPKSASVTPDPASKTYGDPDPTFTGTLSGFLASDAVTATYSRTAGETVAGGPYTISATLSPAAVLGNYTITYNTALFAIGKKAASVTPNADTKVYGSGDPSFTGTLSGFLAGDGVTATYSRTAGETVGGSPYSISATLSPASVLGNYTITYNTAEFTITKKAASVTPNAASKTYGDGDPALTGTLTGFLGGDGVTATYSRTAGETVAGGPYTISATLGPLTKLGNYDITYNTAAFTIDRAPLSASAADKSKVYGDANPAFTGTLSGVKNGEAISASYSSAATAASGVGTYAIVPQISATAAVLANYQTPVLNNGTLTITRAPLSATADNKTKLLNAPNPTFTGTLTGVKNGDAITLTFTTTATQTSPTGSYPIHPVINATSGVLANYQATPALTDGTLTVAYATDGTCVGSPGHAILQPINADGTSVSKGGSTVPAKFRVCDANGVSIGAPGTVASFRLVATITGLVSAVLDDAVTSTTPDTAFRWSATDQQWIFNINTKGMATNKTYVYLITLNDGSTIQFQFGLK